MKHFLAGLSIYLYIVTTFLLLDSLSELTAFINPWKMDHRIKKIIAFQNTIN